MTPEEFILVFKKVLDTVDDCMKAGRWVEALILMKGLQECWPESVEMIEDKI